MRSHKFNAKPTTVDGIRFASLKEARRYQELSLLEKAGVIKDLELQPEFTLQPGFTDFQGNRHRAIKYVADFRYIEDGKIIVEDAKGYETRVFRIKKKLFLKQYHYELRVV